MTRGWALRLTACFLAGGAVLTGCSEKQEASESLPTTSSAEPTEEALPPLGPEDLPLPDEARTQDAAGAEAFVRYYFQLLNRSLTDMDVQYLRQFAEDGCDVCERVARKTEDDAAQGYRYRGGELTVSGEMSVIVTGASEAQSAFTAVQAPMTVLDRGGNPVPGLVFDGENALSSGTITVWDASLQSWTLTELTLG
ncbi:hypothetical protein DQ239_10535 [Blastococcus sp. TF02-09]|uniref:DUF6318 family protein n=1 Tax=Blastococcus sp. TF02-09 TaxID=2250576 RepID=UPI000DE9B14C|nr:DUF6318 family protein [Blastococcus sp. TF02-9]RBY77330.1 hypothetical protein DQ239_10535 [Blastococcus sp. TF02-9]